VGGGPNDPMLALAPADRVAVAGELIGASVAIAAAPGQAGPLTGTIVDETLGTFLLRVAGRARPLRIAKHGLSGTLALGERELPLKGDLLRVRPEDRTKRLLAGGPRRIR
jgi:RNase P/RNase MRP subunit p29